MKINASSYKSQYVLYTLTNDDGSLHHIGVVRLATLTLFGDVELSDGEYTLNVLDQGVDRLKLANAALTIAINENRPDLQQTVNRAVASWKANGRTRRVLCLDTGEIFQNAAAVCDATNTAPSNISHHLNGRAGYKTIKGRTYQWID